MSSFAVSLKAVPSFALPTLPDVARVSGSPTLSWEKKRGRQKRTHLVRAALVEVGPRQVPAIRDRSSDNSNGSLQSLQRGEVTSSIPSSRDRANDMQAEARAMARAANASVYSPQLLSAKYGSRPIKVARLSEI